MTSHDGKSRKAKTRKTKSTKGTKDEITRILQTHSGDHSENRFLASCPTLSNGCFSYRLSQASKRGDIYCNGRKLLGWPLDRFRSFVGNDPPWRSGDLDLEYERPQHNVRQPGDAQRHMEFWSS